MAKTKNMNNESTKRRKLEKRYIRFDGLVKSPRIVMPDLIRHPVA